MFCDPSGNKFPDLINNLVLNAARGIKTDQVPVWVMRQAGRYLPEYHTVRNKAKDFFVLCQTPSMACEVTLQPIDRFSLDASIIFSDILVIPQVLGMEVQMIPGKGPSFPSPLELPSDMAKLKNINSIDIKKELGYTLEAISLVRNKLNGKVPLIGFCGAPWTLMCYMIEGEGSKTFSKAKSWLYKYPNESIKLLEIITEMIIQFLIEQAKHGAQLLMVFDSWAQILTPDAFNKFSLPFIKQIEVRVKEELKIEKEKGNFEYIPPMILFAKGAHFSMESILKETSYEVIALDWETDIEYVHNLCKKLGRKVCLQGNLDPCVLYGDKDTIRLHTKKMIENFYDPEGNITHIANLGHGVYPTHNPEHVGYFIDAVHEYSKEIYSNKNK